ncbi:hypothetical protein JS533_006180 [Bifidobacterium amazonense]|uniref:Uncharacterized protein n=3 Tax=Bifidobacterium TaxID=1678 RepID=A0ABS9VUV0_9BIFI|nr:MULTISPECIES: hypothetical protein [Bifidobacterium]MBT1173321.1 hypothetical protein [Bifidobacterium santillanense]MBT1174088.1 hypothetical protein [Bifidobacterium colobi]MCH9275859.1 hypothetical protein [Bifidobacterium amazonense]
MGKPTPNTSVQDVNARRLVVILLCASIALQALTFAIPGGALSLLCRAVEVLLLVMALLAAVKSNAQQKPLLAIGIGVAASLAATALVIALL